MSTGTCPVCNGSLIVAVTEENLHKWKRRGAKIGEEFKCKNCGAQYMYGTPRGVVPLNREGVPCTHSYKGRSAGRCLTQYECEFCEDRYQIDSGD